MSRPLVSVVLPTLNAERYLDECLTALLEQDWPRDRLEIVLADAGSTDATLEIARRKGVDVIVDNPLRTGEAGKAAGIAASRGDLICSVDSDNVVIGRDWLHRMTAPFEDPDVIGSEVARFHHGRADRLINRWHALSGVADPLTLATGNYARDSLITGTWTGLRHTSESRTGWEKVTLDPACVPVLGANGFIVRREALDLVPGGDYHFDLDFVDALVRAGHRTFARVDAEVHHYFCDGVGQYVRKTRRRADDFFFFRSTGQRTYPWMRRRQMRGVARFAFSTLTVVPLVVEMARGARRRPDPAWLFHVPACWITLGVYAVATVRGALAPRMLDRETWRQ